MKFNPTRFINLLKRDFIIHKKSLLYGLLGFWGFLAILIAINYPSDDPAYAHSHFWIPIFLSSLFIGCLIFTASVFKEFKTPGGRLQFLSLPASNFEKILSRGIYSLILVPLFVAASIWILSSFLITDGSSLGQTFGEEGMEYIPHVFILLHASTFLLALFFNKLVPFKVMISGAIVTLIFALIGVALFTLIFNEYFNNGFRRGPDVNMTLSSNALQFFEYKLLPIGIFLLKFFLAPYLWVVSYFKMKEKQA